MNHRIHISDLSFLVAEHGITGITQVCTQLVRPLLLMNRVLQRQAAELEGLLVRKDAEIQDYRENGATLSRGTRTGA